MTATAAETETLTLRIPREAADLLRRLADDRRGCPEPVEDLAANLLAEAAERRRYGLELRRRKAALMEEAHRQTAEAGITEEEALADILEAVREVRAEKSLRQREDELRGGA